MIDYTVGLSPDPGGLVIRNPALGAGNNEYINIKSFLTVFPMRTWYTKRETRKLHLKLQRQQMRYCIVIVSSL